MGTVTLDRFKLTSNPNFTAFNLIFETLLLTGKPFLLEIPRSECEASVIEI